MLDENKVRLMSEVALYEQRESSELLRINKRINKDLKKPGLLNTLPIAIITFFLAAAVFTAAAYDLVQSVFMTLGATGFAIAAFIVMVIFVIAYCFYARYITLKKYERSRGTLWKNDFNRKKLENILKSEKIEKDREAAR